MLVGYRDVVGVNSHTLDSHMNVIGCHINMSGYNSNMFGGQMDGIAGHNTMLVCITYAIWMGIEAIATRLDTIWMGLYAIVAYQY